MSLDVFLRIPGRQAPTAQRQTQIFVREDGMTRAISLAEWSARFPGRTPLMVDVAEEDTEQVFQANMTHNLGTMAAHAGIYNVLWCPEEHGIQTAAQLTEPLRQGLAQLRHDPERYRAKTPRNGWGTYEGLVAFVETYLAACERFPEAEVSVSR